MGAPASRPQAPRRIIFRGPLPTGTIFRGLWQCPEDRAGGFWLQREAASCSSPLCYGVSQDRALYPPGKGHWTPQIQGIF